MALTPHAELEQKAQQGALDAGEAIQGALTSEGGNFLGVYNSDARQKVLEAKSAAEAQARQDAIDAEFQQAAQERQKVEAARQSMLEGTQRVNVARTPRNDPNDLPPAPPPQGVDADGKPLTAGSITTQTSRTIVKRSQAELQAQAAADAAMMEAATQKRLIESQSAGFSEELINTLASNVKAVDDGVAKLWDEAIKQQKVRLQGITDMLSASASRAADPTAFFTSQGESAGFGAAVATAAGHLASALGGGPNAALETINKAVERNLRAQMFNISLQENRDERAINLMDRWNAITQDQIQARLLTKHSLLQQAEFKLKAQAQRLAGGMANVAYQQTLAGINQQKAEIQRRVDELNKVSVNTQITRAIPLVQQVQQAPQAAPMTGADLRPTSTPAPQGQTAFSAALGKRVNYNPQATQADGTPNSIAAEPQFSMVGANDIYQAAADQTQGTPEEKKAAGDQALKVAALEERRALLEKQSQQGVMTDQELHAAWQNSDVLRNVVPDWRYLKLNDKRVPLGAHGFEFNITEDGLDRKTGKLAQKWEEDKDKFEIALDWEFNAEPVDAIIQELGAFEQLPIGKDGGWDIKAISDDPELANKVQQFKQAYVQAVNVARVAFDGKALNGPGEWKTFEKVVGLPDEIDKFGDWITQNPLRAVEQWKVLKRDLHQWGERARRSAGLYDQRDIVGDNPHSLEGGESERLR